ncbi:hypothetical protein DL765_008346 [Monosporascus sp. GIB2]|nr:hypothetical protein DL765_008346 [Monosporascus sp. GIB2]
MRLDASKIGHFAGLRQVGTGQGVAEPSREAGQTPPGLIDFGDTFTTPTVREDTVEIIWATDRNSNLKVTDVYLYKSGNMDGEEDDFIAEGNIPGDFTDVLVGRDAGIDNSGRPRLQTRRWDYGRNITVLPINSIPELRSSDDFYMEFKLRNGTHTGKSYSPLFGVDHNEGNGFNPTTTQGLGRVKPDEVHRTSTTTDVPTGSSSPPTLSPTLGSASPGAGLDTSVPAAEGSSGQSKGGLNTGAIAGIAVGIVVGLLAVAGLLVWFCLRRRKSGRPLVRAREVGYGSDSGAVAMMPEKEAAGLTESSSHPVYDPSSVPVAHHGDPTAAAASYAPYSDHVVAPGTAVTTPTATSLHEPSPVLHEQQQQGPGGDAGTARQHQQQPIASRYAHLVEEGMTVEEIRRLEEEERQLDAAIEEAGQRHSQARQ